MLVPTIIMGVIAVVLVIIGWQKGHGEHITGLKSAITLTIQIIPLIIFAFIIAGMVQILIPAEAVAKWIGGESGFRGILIGTIAGGFAPGGPYVSLPIVLALVKSGAGVGTLVAFITGWSLLAVGRLPMEVGILGWKFTLVRLACTFFLAPVAGFIAQTFFSWVKLN